MTNVENRPKILITGARSIDLTGIANTIAHYLGVDYNAKVCVPFTTRNNVPDMQHIDIDTINLSYKNNSILCIDSQPEYMEGILFDDFDMSDICYMPIEQFNMIVDAIFDRYNILTIWIDSKKIKPTKNDIIESNFLLQRLEKNKYMYFLDDEGMNIPRSVYSYISAKTLKDKTKILMENS